MGVDTESIANRLCGAWAWSSCSHSIKIEWAPINRAIICQKLVLRLGLWVPFDSSQRNQSQGVEFHIIYWFGFDSNRILCATLNWMLCLYVAPIHFVEFIFYVNFFMDGWSIMWSLKARAHSAPHNRSPPSKIKKLSQKMVMRLKSHNEFNFNWILHRILSPPMLVQQICL